MKSYGGQFDIITSENNLLTAMRNVTRGKRNSEATSRFLKIADTELPQLRNDLLNETYRPRKYTQFKIFDPKPRIITCANFRDRVVHHAVCDVVSPLLERRFIHSSYACRCGKGSHRAVCHAQLLSRKNSYFLKMDVKKFFDSVDLNILAKLICSMFRENKLKTLFRKLIFHPFATQKTGKGLPIGNLTSQWFANLYLDGIDHLLKDKLAIKSYIRYMDDMLLFSTNRNKLWELLDTVKAYLKEERKLELKNKQTILAPVSEGIPFLGMRIFPGTIRIQRKRFLRSRRLIRHREKQWFNNEINDNELIQSVKASTGILTWFGLKGVIKSNIEV